jgi:hypothetical protein
MQEREWPGRSGRRQGPEQPGQLGPAPPAHLSGDVMFGMKLLS